MKGNQKKRSKLQNYKIGLTLRHHGYYIPLKHPFQLPNNITPDQELRNNCGKIYQATKLYKMASYANLPANRKSTPAGFTVSVPDQQLSDFRKLLELSKIGPKTYENELTDGQFGISRDWLVQAKAEWERWDW